MTNIEKVKRILDAGHLVKVTWESGGVYTIISYFRETFCFTDTNIKMFCDSLVFENCTIEVIQRIPTAYKAGDKVLVLSNPFFNEDIEAMVGNVCIVRDYHDAYYTVYADDKYQYYIFPHYCLAPVFDEEISNRDLILSGKEAKVVVDGKEYSVTLKLV